MSFKHRHAEHGPITIQSQRKAEVLIAKKIVVIVISTIVGTCFASLAGLSISALAVPVRRLHIFSIAIAAATICIAYLAFRAATAGKTNEETFVASLHRGVIGAVVGLFAVIFFLIMFGAETFGFLAHALGKPASIFSNFRLLVASVLLGFGAGFVIRMPKIGSDKPN